MKIYYKCGYKYQLTEDYKHTLSFEIDATFKLKFIQIISPNKLTLFKGYAWDGASGPAIDTKNFMRGSLVHDAGYNLMRLGLISTDLYRDKFDRELQRVCRQDGMSWARATIAYWAVKTFAKSCVSTKQPVLIAP